jgi:hypothetical protein
MEAMRKTWTDERLDHFAESVDRRFDVVDRRFDEVDRRFDELKGEMNQVVGRLDTLTKAVVFSTLTLSGSFLAGFIALAFASN